MKVCPAGEDCLARMDSRDYPDLAVIACLATGDSPAPKECRDHVDRTEDPVTLDRKACVVTRDFPGRRHVLSVVNMSKLYYMYNLPSSSTVL